MHFEEIDNEIATLALMSELPLLTPGALKRVLHGDITVCGQDKPASFGKLRGLLMLHYSDQAKAIEALGPEQALALPSERPQADDLRRPPPEGVKKGRDGPSLSCESWVQTAGGPDGKQECLWLAASNCSAD